MESRRKHIDDSHRHHSRITKKRIDELLDFLPLFDVPRREFIVLWEGGEKHNGVIQMPYPEYAQDVLKFFELASKPCWDDYRYETTDPGNMIFDSRAVESADIRQIKAMLTWCVRGERFCDGHWGEILKNGILVNLLKRLAELRRDMD